MVLIAALAVVASTKAVWYSYLAGHFISSCGKSPSLLLVGIILIDSINDDCRSSNDGCGFCILDLVGSCGKRKLENLNLPLTSFSMDVALLGLVSSSCPSDNCYDIVLILSCYLYLQYLWQVSIIVG